MLGDKAAELVCEAGALGRGLFTVVVASVVASQCKRFSFVAAVLSLIGEKSPAMSICNNFFVGFFCEMKP